MQITTPESVKVLTESASLGLIYNLHSCLLVKLGVQLRNEIVMSLDGIFHAHNRTMLWRSTKMANGNFRVLNLSFWARK